MSVNRKRGISSFFTSLAGVSHRNPDGSQRQRIIRACRAGERLTLVREPDNEYDEFAIAVYSVSGRQIGYVKTELAERLCEQLDDGCGVAMYVKEVTGGVAGKPTLGVNVAVFVSEPGVSRVSYDDFVDQVLAEEGVRAAARKYGASSTPRRPSVADPFLVLLAGVRTLVGLLSRFRPPDFRSLYGRLPDWAQPIVLGLLFATAILSAFLLARWILMSR